MEHRNNTIEDYQIKLLKEQLRLNLKLAKNERVPFFSLRAREIEEILQQN